ncbi:MAG: toxin-antitoxin system HicB family antitoxin [Actinobacteria bacterium]|nr:toxin-antitoxin system HicB family antitoxin [Actinomycetota bacterium]
MGRPRVSAEHRIATAVRLPESIHRDLQRVAHDRDVSVNRLVTKAIEEYLDRLPGVDESLSTVTPPAKDRRPA